MGCDIHLYVEVRDEHGIWRAADTWKKDPYVAEDIKYNIKELEGELEVPGADKPAILAEIEKERQRLENPPKYVHWDDSFYSGRNYNLFSILADVRNGRGFAGCDTGDGFIPIAMPKGMPEDVSPRVAVAREGWGVDGHSASWFTVAELDAYDWTSQVTVHRYWMDSTAYYQWYLTGYKGGPQSYCGGVSGPNIEHISEAEMKNRINQVLEGFSEDTPQDELTAAVNEKLGSVYCQAEWKETYADCCQYFIETTLPRLRELGNPEDVRVVFWFDN